MIIDQNELFVTIKYIVPMNNISAYDCCSISARMPLYVNVKAILVKKIVIILMKITVDCTDMVSGMMVHSLLQLSERWPCHIGLLTG